MSTKPTFYGIRVAPHVPELAGLWLTENRHGHRVPVEFRSLRAAQITARAMGKGWEVAPLPVGVGEPVEVAEYERAIREAVRLPHP